MNARAGVTKIHDRERWSMRRRLVASGVRGQTEADAEDRRRHDGGEEHLAAVAGADLTRHPMRRRTSRRTTPVITDSGAAAAP